MLRVHSLGQLNRLGLQRDAGHARAFCEGILMHMRSMRRRSKVHPLVPDGGGRRIARGSSIAPRVLDPLRGEEVSVAAEEAGVAALAAGGP